MNITRITFREIRNEPRLVLFDSHGAGLPVMENKRAWRRDIYPSRNRARKHVVRYSRKFEVQ